jgi:hypothetical protein
MRAMQEATRRKYKLGLLQTPLLVLGRIAGEDPPAPLLLLLLLGTRRMWSPIPPRRGPEVHEFLTVSLPLARPAAFTLILRVCFGARIYLPHRLESRRQSRPRRAAAAGLRRAAPPGSKVPERRARRRHPTAHRPRARDISPPRRAETARVGEPLPFLRRGRAPDAAGADRSCAPHPEGQAGWRRAGGFAG